MNIEELNNVCMEMISHAGEGRGKVYEAIDLFTDDEIDEVEKKLEEAEKYLSEAHRLQFEELMKRQFNGEDIPFSLLLLHAMDITLVSTSEHDLLQALVNSRKRKQLK